MRKQILKKNKKKTENKCPTSATKGLCLKLQGGERWNCHQIWSKVCHQKCIFQYFMDIIRWKDYDSHSFLKHFLEKLIRLNAYENLNKKKQLVPDLNAILRDNIETQRLIITLCNPKLLTISWFPIKFSSRKVVTLFIYIYQSYNVLIREPNWTYQDKKYSKETQSKFWGRVWE